MFIFELQALSDLKMSILFYNEHQEYELECKEKIHYRILNGLCIYDVRILKVCIYNVHIRKCILCPNETSTFFYFLCMKCIVIALHWK